MAGYSPVLPLTIDKEMNSLMKDQDSLIKDQDSLMMQNR